MLAGIVISGVAAGVLSLLLGLALQVGLELVAVSYVLGGLCGCLVFVRLALGRGAQDIGSAKGAQSFGFTQNRKQFLTRRPAG